MIDWLKNYWLNYQLKQALQQGKQTQALAILGQLERSTQKLSCLASLYQQQLKSKTSLQHYRQEIERLTHRLQQTDVDFLLEPQPECIDYIFRAFKLKDIDDNLIQATGIDVPVFTDLEIALVEFLQIELERVPSQLRDRELDLAWADLNDLKYGRDPAYNYRLTPHVYLIKYFLENVYSAYLAWFFIYQQGLLPQKLNILDLAAGVNTSVFGLALLASTIGRFDRSPLTQVNYYSLERQADLQYRGLQFWRRYIESFARPLNTYFRFKTANLFDLQSYFRQIPAKFFDFVVISHCFFYEPEARHLSEQIYQQIFQEHLSPDGLVLLLVQGKKLFGMFDFPLTEDCDRESALVKKFAENLGLEVVWFKYFSCTGKRKSNKQEFARFACQHLPPQEYLSQLARTYLRRSYRANYAIDDYIILARPLKV